MDDILAKDRVCKLKQERWNLSLTYGLCSQATWTLPLTNLPLTKLPNNVPQSWVPWSSLFGGLTVPILSASLCIAAVRQAGFKSSPFGKVFKPIDLHPVRQLNGGIANSEPGRLDPPISCSKQIVAREPVRQGSYDSSYAFLNIRSADTPAEGLRFCVNFQQYRSRALPAVVEDAVPYQIGWWNNTFNETDVCKKPDHSLIFDPKQMVPALYRTDRGKSSCNQTKDKHFVSQQVRMLEEVNATAILFLVDEGKFNVHEIPDFLFSQFYNPEINESNHHAWVFYAYNHLFKDQILPLLRVQSAGQQEAQLRIYRPPSWLLDSSVFVLWLLATACISLGCAWMVWEVKYGVGCLKDSSSSGSTHVCLNEDNVETDQSVVVSHQQPDSVNVVVVVHSPAEQTPASPAQPSPLTGSSTDVVVENGKKKEPKRSDADAIAQMGVAAHCFYVVIFVAFVVAVLLLSFFFRPYAVLFFNVFLVVLGTLSMHNISYSLLSVFVSDCQLFSLSQVCCFSSLNCLTLQQKVPLLGRLAKSHLFSRKIKLFYALLLVCCFSVCVVWFLNRSNPYAFLLLDFINACLCIYAVKGTQIRSLRLLTFLLLAMFVYDIFMVFGTRLLTPSGCSVMLQVVTGMDCKSQKESQENNVTELYPLPPIAVSTPEKIPILFYIPMLNDPMAECFDVEIEKEFRHVMLGLGDVIVPGYLIAFCFYVDVVKRNRYYSFGIVGLIGYSLGMMTTFLALKLMATAQPALIYLVPFTLIPIFLWACYNKCFCKSGGGT